MKTKFFARFEVVRLNIKIKALLPNTGMLTLAALGVHLLTSLGIVCSLLAILAVFDRNLNLTFLWLGVALFIDAIDGSLARKVGVSKFAPNINGLMMDSIVDFTNYILIPCLILSTADYLLPSVEVQLSAIILVISLFSYSRISVSDVDFRYVGFPVAWNIIVVYLFIFEMGQLANTLVILLFVVLKFVPLKYVHPFRTKRLRKPTLFMTGLWFISIGLLCLNKTQTLSGHAYLLACGSLAASTLYFCCLTLASGFESRSAVSQQLSRANSITS